MHRILWQQSWLSLLVVDCINSCSSCAPILASICAQQSVGLLEKVSSYSSLAAVKYCCCCTFLVSRHKLLCVLRVCLCICDLNCRYFEYSHVTPELPFLDPKSNYLFVHFPHGSFPMGSWLSLGATKAEGIRRVQPVIHMHMHMHSNMLGSTNVSISKATTV